MVNSIKTFEEINTLRNWFKCHNDKSYDFHLLYFDLGINTCYTIDELQNLKWSELLNNDGTVVDSITIYCQIIQSEHIIRKYIWNICLL